MLQHWLSKAELLWLTMGVKEGALQSSVYCTVHKLTTLITVSCLTFDPLSKGTLHRRRFKNLCSIFLL